MEVDDWRPCDVPSRSVAGRAVSGLSPARQAALHCKLPLPVTSGNDALVRTCMAVNSLF